MNVHSIARMSGGSAYLWMAARARNALRRVVVFGIVGGVVFIAALIAFVLVPRNASRKALAVAAQIEAAGALSLILHAGAHGQDLVRQLQLARIPPPQPVVAAD